MCRKCDTAICQMAPVPCTTPWSFMARAKPVLDNATRQLPRPAGECHEGRAQRPLVFPRYDVFIHTDNHGVSFCSKITQHRVISTHTTHLVTTDAYVAGALYPAWSVHSNGTLSSEIRLCQPVGNEIAHVYHVIYRMENVDLLQLRAAGTTCMERLDGFWWKEWLSSSTVWSSIKHDGNLWWLDLGWCAWHEKNQMWVESDSNCAHHRSFKYLMGRYEYC